MYICVQYMYSIHLLYVGSFCICIMYMRAIARSRTRRNVWIFKWRGFLLSLKSFSIQSYSSTRTFTHTRDVHHHSIIWNDFRQCTSIQNAYEYKCSYIYTYICTYSTNIHIYLYIMRSSYWCLLRFNFSENLFFVLVQ